MVGACWTVRMFVCLTVLLCSIDHTQVEGNGFLYKQVRHLVGAMLTAGRGRLTLGAVSAALERGNAQPPGAPVQFMQAARRLSSATTVSKDQGLMHHDDDTAGCMLDAQVTSTAAGTLPSRRGYASCG
jgi:tRNA pseudouridine synthase